MRNTLAYRGIRKFVYALTTLIARCLPLWKNTAAVDVLPPMLAVPVSLPLNYEKLPQDFSRHFISEKFIPKRRIFLLKEVAISGEGVVFKNLRIFTPSLTWLRDLPLHRRGKLLLKQWQASGKVLPSDQRVALVWDQWSAENYYHWMVESLPRLLLVQMKYPDCSLLIPEPAPEFVRSTIALMGFKSLVPLQRNKEAVIRAERLLLPELVYYHEPHEAAVIPDYINYKPTAYSNPGTKAAGGTEELILTVKKKLLAHVGASAVKGGRKVYVSRARQKTRRLINEEEILPILQKWGFETVYFEDMSFQQQLMLMRECSILMGMHGANMVNMLFLPQEARVIELMNLNHFNEAYYLLASSLQIPYYSVPCAMADAAITPAADSVVLNDAHLRVSPVALEETIVACFQTRQA